MSKARRKREVFRIQIGQLLLRPQFHAQLCGRNRLGSAQRSELMREEARLLSSATRHVNILGITFSLGCLKQSIFISIVPLVVAAPRPPDSALQSSVLQDVRKVCRRDSCDCRLARAPPSKTSKAACRKRLRLQAMLGPPDTAGHHQLDC